MIDGSEPRFTLIHDMPLPAAMEHIMPIMHTGFDPSYGEAWNHMQTLSMLSMAHCRWSICFNTMQLNAAIGFCISRHTVYDEELLMIAVVPSERRMGAAHYMLQDLILRSAASGCAKIFLEVRVNNDARQFYIARGFNQIGTRKGYYRSNEGRRLDALTYAYNL